MCLSAALMAATSLAATGMNAMSSSAAQGAANDANNLAIGNAQSNQRNKAMYDALAIKMGRAGTSDSEGNSTQYDAGSNTWLSNLGPLAEAAQRSSDGAATIQNTVDVGNNMRANRSSDLTAALRARQADSAAGDIEAFQPMTGEQGSAAAAQPVLAANRDALRETLGSTARSFARTGTGAAPVLTAIARGGAQNLQNGLAQARAGGAAGATQANSGMLTMLQQRLGALSGGYNPNPTRFAPSNASSAMSQLLASLRQGSVAPSMSAGQTIGYGTQGMNAAVESANKHRQNDPTGANILGAGKELVNLLGQINWKGSPGAGNVSDLPVTRTGSIS